MHRLTKLSPSGGTISKVASIALAAASAAACSDSTSPRDPVAVVQFVNAAPRYAAADLTVDNTLAVNDQLYGHVGTAFYAKVLSTPRTLEAFPGSSSTAVASADLTPVKNQTYTVVLTQHTTGGGLLILPDTVTAPASGKIKLRVVNVAPSAGSVDVYVTDVASGILTATPQKVSVPFEGSSDYISVDAAITQRVRVTVAGTKTVLLDTNDSLLDLDLSAGGAATILLMDASGGGPPYRALYVTDRL